MLTFCVVNCMVCQKLISEMGQQKMYIEQDKEDWGVGVAGCNFKKKSESRPH